jgi:Fe-S-cluster containining protein
VSFHLRGDLGRVVEDGRLVALEDPVFARRIDLGPATAALAERLDGRPTAELLAALAVEHGPRPRVENMLRRFLLLGLVDEAAVETRARLGALRRGEARLVPAVLAGARFACQGSGACCQGHRLGPLADADAARLEALGLADAVVQASDGRFLAQIDGRCRFLEGDARCGLHRLHGAEAKPGFCRLYPLEVAATLEGMKIFDRGGCARIAQSARAGLPLAEQAPDVLALTGQAHDLFHPVVRLDERTLCDYAHLLPFARAAIALVGRRAAGPGASLRAVGRWLARFGSALASCPLEPGEPERSRDAVLAAEPAELFAAVPDGVEREGAEMLGVVLADLGELAATLGATFGARYAAAIVATLSRARDACFAVAEGGAPPRHDAAELVRLSLAQQLFSTYTVVADRATAGILRMAVLAACAVTADDPSRAHSHAVRLLGVNAAAAVLVQHEELTPAALDGIALLGG